MVCALFQLGGDRALHVVVAEQDATDRARLIAHAYAHDVCNTVGRHAPRMKHGVEVVRTRNVRNARRRGVWIASKIIGIRDVAAPGYLRIELRNPFHESASPHHLQSSLAPATRLDIPAVPLGARLQVVEGTHDAQRHSVEIGVRRVAVIPWSKGVAWWSISLECFTKISVVLVVMPDQVIAMCIHRKANVWTCYILRHLRDGGWPAISVEHRHYRILFRLTGIFGNAEPASHVASQTRNLCRIDGKPVLEACRRLIHKFNQTLERNCRELRLCFGPERIEVSGLRGGKLHLLGRDARAAAEGDLLATALFDSRVVGTCKMRVHAHDARHGEARLHEASVRERNRVSADHPHVVVRRPLPDHVELLVLQGKRQRLDAIETEVEPNRLVLYIANRILFVRDRLEAKILDIPAGADFAKHADRKARILNRVVRRLDPFRRAHYLRDAHLVDLAAKRKLQVVGAQIAEDEVAGAVGHGAGKRDIVYRGVGAVLVSLRIGRRGRHVYGVGEVVPLPERRSQVACPEHARRCIRFHEQRVFRGLGTAHVVDEIGGVAGTARPALAENPRARHELVLKSPCLDGELGESVKRIVVRRNDGIPGATVEVDRTADDSLCGIM